MKKIVKWYKTLVGIAKLERKINRLENKLEIEHLYILALLRRVDLLDKEVYTKEQDHKL